MLGLITLLNVCLSYLCVQRSRTPPPNLLLSAFMATGADSTLQSVTAVTSPDVKLQAGIVTLNTSSGSVCSVGGAPATRVNLYLLRSVEYHFGLVISTTVPELEEDCVLTVSGLGA